MKAETIFLFKKSVDFYCTEWRYVSEYSTLHNTALSISNPVKITHTSNYLVKHINRTTEKDSDTTLEFNKRGMHGSANRSRFHSF